MNQVVWMLLTVGAALFLLNMVALGILKLQRAPLVLADLVAGVLLVLLVDAYKHQGVNQLERVDLCTPAASALPRAPRPTANLAGCPGYVAPVIDSNRDIPVTGVPDIRATPSWAADPGR